MTTSPDTEDYNLRFCNDCGVMTNHHKITGQCLKHRDAEDKEPYFIDAETQNLIDDNWEELQDTNDTLDAQLDEITLRLCASARRALHSDTPLKYQREARNEAKQALTKLIADREREARVDEVELTMKVKAYSGVVERYLYNRFNELRKEGDK